MICLDGDNRWRLELKVTLTAYLDSRTKSTPALVRIVFVQMKILSKILFVTAFFNAEVMIAHAPTVTAMVGDCRKKPGNNNDFLNCDNGTPDGDGIIDNFDCTYTLRDNTGRCNGNDCFRTDIPPEIFTPRDRYDSFINALNTRESNGPRESTSCFSVSGLSC